jgi:hypothetical protein
VNRDLRWARQDRDKARDVLKDHRQHCHRCSQGDPCDKGVTLIERVTETAVAVKREEKLARQPIPGQGELFGLDEMASR